MKLYIPVFILLYAIQLPVTPAWSQSGSNIRFMVIGDWGTGGKGQRKVASRMAQEYKQNPAAAVFCVGDNFYPSGVKSVTDPQWQSTFENVYNRISLPMPFWSVLGNHDYRSNPQAQVEYTGSTLSDGKVTRWHMPDRQWVLDMMSGDSTVSVRCLGIDTQQIIGSASTRKRQIAWIDSVLAATSADWVFVFGHHQVYSYGHYGNGNVMVKHLAPVLRKHGADAYFDGHEHDLQMLGPVDGVYYVISGAAAATRPSSMGERSLFASSELGFVTVSATAKSARIVFHGANGETLFEHTITDERNE